MMRVAVSIKAGRMTPSTILRRLGSESTKNKLYFAFRELGRVIRTLFLLKYLDDPELRRTIHAATNKSEQFNDFAQWLMFGGEGVIAENVRHEQRKVIKYNPPRREHGDPAQRAVDVAQAKGTAPISRQDYPRKRLASAAALGARRHGACGPTGRSIKTWTKPLKRALATRLARVRAAQ
jgi:hypothetical protein